ncbi:MAG: MBL fold metallo-hydrolase [Clostridia bacterium]|nr:MBL fold metallo-hydrolase [Clostridia bacterium]
MEIKALVLGDIEVNCYLVSTDKAAVVIDPGYRCVEALEFLKNANDKERLILLTHAHFDHIGFADELAEITDSKIAIGEKDAPALLDNNLNLSALFGAPLSTFSADILLDDNDEITVGDLTFKVIHTPGHTVGGVCYLCGDTLFSGDTLFAGSIGRTDFPGGSFETLKNSIKRIYTLPDDTVLLSGHGGKTTVINEKRYNPFVRG